MAGRARFQDPLEEEPRRRRGHWIARRPSPWSTQATRGIRRAEARWRIDPALLDAIRAEALRLGCQPGDLFEAILYAHLMPERLSASRRIWVKDSDRLAQARRARGRHPAPSKAPQ